MNIPLKIKGSRNYIQGGDFFDGIEKLIEDEKIIDLSFRKFTLNKCNLEMVKSDKTVAILKTNVGLYYINETEMAVTERVEYNEELITRASNIKGNVISLLKFIDGFSVIEHVIALTKLLNNTIDKLEHGKWVFAQIKLTENFPKEFNFINIESTQRISKKFSKNVINIDGKVVGFINFIVGEP